MALTKIPDNFREEITRKIWGDQTFDEIGKTHAISPHTAASRYRYGMEALRKSVAGEKVGLGM